MFHVGESYPSSNMEILTYEIQVDMIDTCDVGTYRNEQARESISF